MSLATITTKGQVTIPKDIRESLHLHSGDKIEIVVQNSGEAIIRSISNRVDDLFCKLRKKNQKTVSVADMDSIIKQRMKSKCS